MNGSFPKSQEILAKDRGPESSKANDTVDPGITASTTEGARETTVTETARYVLGQFLPFFSVGWRGGFSMQRGLLIARVLIRIPWLNADN